MITRCLIRGAHAVVVTAAMTALGTAVYCVTASIGLQVKDTDVVALNVCLALPWLVLLAAAWCIWKHLRYAVAVPLLAVSAAFLCYMAWDDRTRPAAPSIALLVPADSKSYIAYQRLLKDPAVSSSAPTSTNSSLPMFPGNVAEWPAFVIEHRSEIEEAWTGEASAQSWINDMAHNTPEGLYPPQSYNAPGLDYSRIRRTSQLRWAKFHLYVADQKPDEAAQLLLPLLQAGHNLQRAGTNLVNQMIAVVLLKGCYQRLELIAENSALSRATRQTLHATLNEAPPITLVFSNAFLGEEFFARSSIEAITANQQVAVDQLVQTQALVGEGRDLPPHLGTLLGRLLFNPHRMEREYSAYLKQSCELLQNRHVDRSSKLAADFEYRTTSWRLKNPVGKLFTAMVLPAFQKIGASFWEAEDQRVALLARL